MATSATRALLFDLDDTLLINDMDVFLPHYYRALLDRVSPLCPTVLFLDALKAGARAMWANNGLNGTNAEAFEREFFFRLPCEQDEIVPLLQAFYQDDFDALHVHTAVDPDARALVELVFERGYQVAIVTQPIFPLTAIESRLRWAGVGVDEFAYDFVSCYEVMRACKPHRHFYEDVMDRLGRSPDECLMVGDSVSADMAAGQYGLKTFWVTRRVKGRPPRVACDAKGSLADLIGLVRTGGIDDL